MNKWTKIIAIFSFVVALSASSCGKKDTNSNLVKPINLNQCGGKTCM